MPTPISRVSPSTVSTPLAVASKAWAESFNFQSATAVTRLDIPRTKAPTSGPEAVQRAYALYKTWEANDLGSVRLLQVPVNGSNVFALHTTTDGDDGYLELFSATGALLATGVTGYDAAGKPNVTWDKTLGQVRERVAPQDGSASVQEFFAEIKKASASASSSGATLTTDELRAAAKKLVGPELTTRSVDGFENAALFRVLADPAAKLTSTSRDYAEQLAMLYTDAKSTTLHSRKTKPLGTSTWAANANFGSATVNATGAPPRLNTMIEFSRQNWNQLPSQVVPVTRTEAQKLLRDSGATAAEAKAAVDALADSTGTLYAGRFYEEGSNWVPADKGLALFGVSGRSLTGLNVPNKPSAPSGLDPRAVIKNLLGVDREPEVVSHTSTATGDTFALRWRPPSGPAVEATLTVPSNGKAPTLSKVTIPPPLETSLQQVLAEKLQTAPQNVLGWVGRDTSAGPGFVIAHRKVSGGPITLSTMSIALGGAATVTSKPMGTADAQLAKDLALNLARAQAYQLVADPGISDDARLEVALRTQWATTADLQSVDPLDSAVGFDAATERFQFMLPKVWGDNAVFVTFAKNGGVRVEDFN